MKRFAVFGNPIHHSHSPFIHKCFAKQFNIKNFFYEKILVDINKFYYTLNKFFLNGGIGINVTLPFKNEAFRILKNTTKRAKISKTVNTIKKENGILIGDNTDGIGLLEDLKRLNMINKKFNILIIGSGGAAQSIIPSLLFFKCNIYIINRTLSNAINLHKTFNYDKKIVVLDIEKQNKILQFDLIINATSANILKKNLVIPDFVLINKFTKCYDLSYQNSGLTQFLLFCKSKNAIFLADGIGMLVYQAAYSFLFWHYLFPNVNNTIKKLRSKLIF